MLPEILPKPLGVCDVCHALTKVHEALNNRCDKVVNGRRCYGHYKSALGYLWDRCEACDGHGKVGTQACTNCQGFGWLLYG